MKIIPNFISPDIFKKMQDTVFASDFPFYYSPSITEGDAGKDFMFCHLLFHEQKQTSSYFNSLLTPLLGRLNFNYLIRAKLNCYTRKSKYIYTALHRDYPTPHSVALFSFNTCNGFTYFEDTKEKIKSVANQVVIFDGQRKHCSVSQTDTNLLININLDIS